ncbi:MAG: FixH family protein [Phenylobacterium sp.]|uniref:FixH family protein n=1 Tax=Phenylobacterium sp. TaxID=1871053 RepID=UPI00391ABDD8
MTTHAEKPPFRITGWHVLVAMVAFFGVVIAVDGAFLVVAYRTHPGQVSVTPYEDGLAYNRTLAQREAQAALGWRAAAAADGGAVTVEVLDRDGRPVTGLKITGTLQRPATEAGAQGLAFTEAAPGRYAAPVADAAGVWDLAFKATGGGAQAFEGERRLTWP